MLKLAGEMLDEMLDKERVEREKRRCTNPLLCFQKDSGGICRLSIGRCFWESEIRQRRIKCRFHIHSPLNSVYGRL